MSFYIIAPFNLNVWKRPDSHLLSPVAWLVNWLFAFCRASWCYKTCSRKSLKARSPIRSRYLSLCRRPHLPCQRNFNHPIPSRPVRPPQSVTPSPSSGSPAIASRSNRVREAFKMIAFNFHVFVYWCIYFDRTSFRMWPLTVSCHGWVPNCLLGHSPPDRIHALFFFFFPGSHLYSQFPTCTTSLRVAYC